MLTLTALAGFGVSSAQADASINPFTIDGIADTAPTAFAQTSDVIITGINVPVTLRLSLTQAATGGRIASVIRNNLVVAQVTAGTATEFQVSAGQALRFAFQNPVLPSLWSGTATLVNLTDGGAQIASFSYVLLSSDPGPGNGDPGANLP
jgi:hypothetical protein